ncbi:MAG: tetratricopeptide repeat protein, partial [Armatimonadota bacterium]
PARHRSLDAVLRSSLDQLPNEVRIAFSRLGVFRGGFDAAAAKAVACVGPAILETLRRLALIVAFEDRDGSLRFRMLEPLRDVAMKESGDARTAHAAYFADWIEANRADELPPPPRVFGQRIALQIRERDNIRAALETCSLSQDPAGREVGLRIVAAFWSHWYLRNEGAEMERWARLLLSGPGEKADQMIRASARLSLALAIRERGAREEWSHEVAEAIEILQRGPRNRNLAFALHNQGLALGDLGRYDKADESYLASEAIWHEIGDDRNYSITRHNRGMIALERRDLDLAELLVGEAREFFELHNSTYVALGHATIGSIRRAKGDLAGAAAALSDAARLHRQVGYVRGWAQNERDLGVCLFELGNIDEARKVIEGTIAAFRKVGDRHGEATALAALGWVTGETWHADEARGVMLRHDIPAVGEFLERL